jgi:hypothetical protein
MSRQVESLDLCLYWYDRPMTGQQYLERLKAFLLHLQSSFPVFSCFHLISSSGSSTEPLAPELPGFGKQVSRELPTEWAYSNEDPNDKAFRPSSRSRSGFSSAFSSAPFGDESAFVVEFACGKDDARAVNSVIGRVPASMEGDELIVDLFRAMADFWSATHGSCSRPVFDDVLDQPVGDVRVGWLTLVPNAAAAAYVPTGFRSEPLGSRLLIRREGPAPQAGDEAAVQALIHLRHVFEPHGFLRNPRRS